MYSKQMETEITLQLLITPYYLLHNIIYLFQTDLFLFEIFN